MRERRSGIGDAAPQWLSVIVYAAFFLGASYLVIAFAVFEWRNPKANRMAFYREFIQVVTWQRMDKYQ